MEIELANLKEGETAEIVGYKNPSGGYLNKILSMGLTKGTEIKVIKIGPLGDPVEIEVRGFKLSLRKKEAKVLILRRCNSEQ